MASHSTILAGKSHGQRSLASYSPWGYIIISVGIVVTFYLFSEFTLEIQNYLGR